MNVVNCVNSQMVSKFDVVQYILYVDHNMKYLEERLWIERGEKVQKIYFVIS